MKSTYFIAAWLCCLAWSLSETRAESWLDKVDDVAEKSELAIICATLSTSCEDCLTNPKCLWCSSHLVKCIPYPDDSLIPSSDVCELGDARWGVCWVNYLILLIVMGVIAGIIVISFILCIWCCCCKK